MAAKDPTRRSAAAKIASLHSWARTPDRAARTRKARQAADGWATWEKKVDPDGLMAPSDRRKAAEARRRAHFTEMGLRSGASRRAKKNAA
jgi:hypothetical protein